MRSAEAGRLAFGLAKPTRLVRIGESAGAEPTVRGENLRTSGVGIYRCRPGLHTGHRGRGYEQVVSWTRSGELGFDLEVVPLSAVESAGQRTFGVSVAVLAGAACLTAVLARSRRAASPS